MIIASSEGWGYFNSRLGETHTQALLKQAVKFKRSGAWNYFAKSSFTWHDMQSLGRCNGYSH